MTPAPFRVFLRALRPRFYNCANCEPREPILAVLLGRDSFVAPINVPAPEPAFPHSLIQFVSLGISPASLADAIQRTEVGVNSNICLLRTIAGVDDLLSASPGDDAGPHYALNLPWYNYGAAGITNPTSYETACRMATSACFHSTAAPNTYT